MRFDNFLIKLFAMVRKPVFWAFCAALSGAVAIGTPVSAMVQQAELKASDGISQNYFGDAVALNSTGNTALVGAINGGFAYTAGAAYVYTRTNGVWSQQAELAPSDAAATDRFGDAVALSEDGNTAIVGAPNKHIGANSDQGAAYVFRKIGSSWVQQQELLASDGAELDSFGSSVALSSDGNTALIGAWGDNSAGSAYIFKWNGSSWAQQAKLTASDAAVGNTFGLTVSLSGDGTIALVGDWYNNSLRGAAYVFKWNGVSWTQQQKLTASDGAAGDLFSSSLHISGDGSTIISGSPQKTVGTDAGQGAAYVFGWNGSSWIQQQELTAAHGGAGDSFGKGGSLRNDGQLIMISAPGQGSGRGAAYLFDWDGSIWAEWQLLTASDGVAGDDFGGDLAMSVDGTTALFGARAKQSSAGSAAYVFVSEIDIITSFTGNGDVTCSPDPVQAHSDSVCTIEPTNDFGSSDFNYITGVSVMPVGFPFWTSVGPTPKYTFSDMVYPYYIDATFAPTNIWLYQRIISPPFVFWSLLATDQTIADALLDILISYPETDEVRLPTGAFAESGGVLCYEAINVTLSGGWTTGTSRAAAPMSTVAGPLRLTNSCSLVIDGITVD